MIQIRAYLDKIKTTLIAVDRCPDCQGMGRVRQAGTKRMVQCYRCWIDKPGRFTGLTRRKGA